MEKLKIKLDCENCGCPAEKIQLLYCGPIIKIRCPNCCRGITEGGDIHGMEALVARWNKELIL